MKDIRIRTATTADAPALLDIYAPYVRETAISFEYDVPSLQEFEGRVSHTLSRYPWIVAEQGGRVLGYAYASAFHPRAAYQWCAEASIYLARDARGHGLGARLYDALEDILRRQNMLVLYACIASPSEEDEHLTRASLRFHARMGFRSVGEFPRCGYKFGRWYGMVWMEKRLAEPSDPPAPVIPFSEMG
ncbi:GNAT family N-acetyltransferase [Mailhella massiliensis]|uniref:N-acetyltransferase family protein n=1 Tax=Mailhella massiliensis TaxID=1903261 RepID=A0A921AXD2_9BACT|nr:GNAT family N-acetyltransferase [Mailhella massiliensis]HJD97513.1 N-acetyltransferase family protein [Mailhella massiliensis]